MLSPVRVNAPNIIAMYSELVYTHRASLIDLSLTPPSLTLHCKEPEGGGVWYDTFVCVVVCSWRLGLAHHQIQELLHPAAKRPEDLS